VAQELEITLESKPESVARARQVAAQVIDGVGEQTLEDVRLIISELVTNAVKHGPDGRVKVRLRRDGRTIRGAVEDEGTSPFHHRRGIPPGPIGGLGLHLVDRLSDRWGVDSRSARVWFELKDHSAGKS
jgi:anti-sigma regulatory factor (Ser/Thr protein kinase)